MDMAVMTPANKVVKLRPVFDLTWHTWAGLPVTVILEARDFKGQTALSQPFHLHIPERPFIHPAANKIIALRHDLAWDPESAAPDVAAGLETVLGDIKSYNGAVPVFLSLRSAASRLIYDPTTTAAKTVIPQLWDTALAIDEGQLPLAARTMRQAQENLRKLLNTPNPSADRIAEAMEKLRAAMGNFLNEAFKNLQRNMAASGLPPLTPEQIRNILRPEDIAAFLDQLQARALAGDTNAARDMLAQLEKMTDSLDPARAAAMPKDMQFMAQALRRMQDLIKAQKNLLAATEKDKAAPDTQKKHNEQNKLIDRLETMMAKANDALGKTPENLQKADKAMQRAADFLGNNKAAPSIPHQKAAIDALQKGQDKMRERLRARLKQMMIAALGGGGIDPLGRVNDNGRMSNLLNGSPVKIPDHGQRRQVQDIMQTLRERSGDRSRPEYELDYYKRLMRQF
jgi:tetratricopeptide (TPR) repeat protein